MQEAREQKSNSVRLGRELATLRGQHQKLHKKSALEHTQMQQKVDSLEMLRCRTEEHARRADRKVVNLKSQVRELEAKLLAAQQGTGSLSKMTVIKKLASNRTIGKRLAAAVHPDKVPSELSEPAADVFRFLQAIREQSENGCSG